MSKKPFFFALFFVAPPVVAWSQTVENSPKPSTYVVKEGDCLWNISKRVWGDPLKWPLLFATNESKIKNPNLIYPGQKFTIPTTLTAEELKKAYELAQERAVPLPARAIGVEGSTLKARKNHQAGEGPSETSAASVPAANEQPQNAVNQPSSAANPTAGTTPSASGTSTMPLIVVILLALGGGLYLWFRKRSKVSLQEPKPLSSFPQVSEPPAGRPNVGEWPVPTPQPGLVREEKTPVSPVPNPSATLGQPSTPPSAMPTGSGTPASGSSSTLPPVSNPQNHPQVTPPAQPIQESLPGTKGGEFTGTITSISVSQPPQPSKAEPSSSPSSSGLPSTPASSTSPAPKPPENKPPDTNSNPTATNP